MLSPFQSTQARRRQYRNDASDTELHGYFVNGIEAVESDDSNDDAHSTTDEDDYNIDVSDERIYSDEFIAVKPTSSKRRTVSFNEIATSKVLKVQGNFPFIDPWWDATLSVHHRSRSGTHMTTGIPKYMLRTDTNVASEHIIRIFLRACEVDGQHIDLFTSHGEIEDTLTFDNLDAHLTTFQQKNKEVANVIRRKIDYTPVGRMVTVAQSLPELFARLLQLLPRYFHSIINTMDCLPEIQSALITSPWIFGFSNVLKERFGLCGCEASLEAFRSSKLLNELETVERDALVLYDVLKLLCHKYGHTHVEPKQLRRCCDETGYVVSNFTEARNFLLDNEVTEEDPGGLRIYLYKYWLAEYKIAKTFAMLQRQHEDIPWTFDIDFDREEFVKIRSDPDQVEAAKLIATKPIVVMSGKGGCGKTEVVSSVFRFASETGLLALQSQSEVDDQSLVEAISQHEQQTTQSKTEGNDDDDNGNNFDDSVDDQFFKFSMDSFDFGDEFYLTDIDQKLPVIRGEREISELPVDVAKSVQAGCCFSETVEGNVEFPAEMATSNQPGCCSSEISERNIGLPADVAKSVQPDCFCISETNEGKIDACDNDDGVGTKPKSRPLRDNSGILLVAPTGKAAHLLGNRTGLCAYTIHQIIFSYYNWRRQSKNYGPENSKWKFSNVRVLVVDEGSLVAVTTFNQLLTALNRDEPCNLWKIVILGDVHQLPSIEPGSARLETDLKQTGDKVYFSKDHGCYHTAHESSAFLFEYQDLMKTSRFLVDVFEAMSRFNCAVTLRTNHRASSHCIVENAERITRRLSPTADPDRNFHIFILPEDREDESLSNARDQTVRALLKGKFGDLLQDDVTSQFIAFRRDDCNAINEICCRHYVNHTTKDARKRYSFEVGDKVCCTKNGRVTPYDPDSKYVSSTSNPRSADTFLLSPNGSIAVERREDSAAGVVHGNVAESNGIGHKSSACESSNKKKRSKDEDDAIRLCNGEIFFIKSKTTIQDPPRRQYDVVTLHDPELNRDLEFRLDHLLHACKLRHAWARTIHTFQGSESPTVVYVISSAYYQTWQHVYTAVTRGRSKVIIITRKSALDSAVRKNPIARQTGLKEQLLKLLDTSKMNASVQEVSKVETDDVSGDVLRRETEAGERDSICNSSQLPANYNSEHYETVGRTLTLKREPCEELDLTGADVVLDSDVNAASGVSHFVGNSGDLREECVENSEKLTFDFEESRADDVMVRQQCIELARSQQHTGCFETTEIKTPLPVKPIDRAKVNITATDASVTSCTRRLFSLTNAPPSPCASKPETITETPTSSQPSPVTSDAETSRFPSRASTPKRPLGSRLDPAGEDGPAVARAKLQLEVDVSPLRQSLTNCLSIGSPRVPK